MIRRFTLEKGTVALITVVGRGLKKRMYFICRSRTKGICDGVNVLCIGQLWKEWTVN